MQQGICAKTFGQRDPNCKTLLRFEDAPGRIVEQNHPKTMNAKTAKLLRKYAKHFGYDYNSVKTEFKKLPKDQQIQIQKEMFGSMNYGIK